MLELEEKKLVGQSVYEQLRADITTGRLAPGQKLKLNQLRDRYGVSVNTLRETLMRLVSDGFVLFVDQKGFRVKPISKQDLHELHELRVMLELAGVRKSLANKSGQLEWKSKLASAHYRLSHMEKLMLEDEQANVQAWEQADREFHCTMVSHCGSEQLIRYHANVIELFMRYQVLTLDRRPFRGRDSQDEHNTLLECLLNGDEARALALLEQHINRGLNLPTDSH